MLFGRGLADIMARTNDSLVPFVNPAIASPSYFIGVDTGGTYTDAVVIDAANHRVIGSAKAITTKGDLAVGVRNAITQALAALPFQMNQRCVDLVSVSTTLATNAVVEGHGGSVGVILIGFDDAMIAKTGIEQAFPGVALAQVAGGHDHSGHATVPLDTSRLLEIALAMGAKVEAFAIASRFAVRNPEHEQQARDLVLQATGKPVTLSSELSASLDAPRRALTATLNARLISRISHLAEAVRRAMLELDLVCPLMIAKGDGTLALADAVVSRPIETVLSGPAASLVGAQWLSGLDNFILSDMGGTTTDLAMLIEGRPRITDDGAQIGGWRTMVRAIDVRTVGLGGDSEVHLSSNGQIHLGPQRVVPVSLMCHRDPHTLTLLEADLADVERGGSLHGRYVVLPFGSDRHGVAGPAQASTQERPDLSQREADVLRRVTHVPQPLCKVGDSVGAQRTLNALRQKGLIQIVAFTPSDAAHVLGLQNNWSAPGALLAAKLLCRLREMRFPTPDLTQRLAQDVWHATVAQTARVILQCAFDNPLDKNPLLDAVCEGQGTIGFGKVALSATVPVVAVGGPVKVYYPEVGKRINTEIVFPEFCDVANAVGAAMGMVAHEVVLRVDRDGGGGFLLHGVAGSRSFASPGEALAEGTLLARQHAFDNVIAMGAQSPEITVTLSKKYLPGFADDNGLLEAVIRAEAVGRPAMGSRE